MPNLFQHDGIIFNNKMQLPSFSVAMREGQTAKRIRVQRTPLEVSPPGSMQTKRFIIPHLAS